MAGDSAPRRAPGPRGLGLREVRAMKRDPLVWFAGLRERYGGLAALRLGPVRDLGVNDPDLIRQVLVDDARGYSQFAVHRDARFWPEPERFDPERWLDPAAARVPRGAFFPFGDGPRRCIGEHFARAEAGIVMATLARTWSLARVTHEPVELEAKVTLRPRGGLRMRVAAR